jgi:cell wall assembly regulator SMI1
VHHRCVQSWQRLVDALGDAVAQLKLNAPASEAAIVGAETLFERTLPADYRALLAIADGQDEGGIAIFPTDGTLLPLAKVIEAWLANGAFVVREWDSEPVDPRMLVRPLVWHPTRIPIGMDASGQSGPFLDLWPGPRGTEGQLITLVSECDFAVIGTSLDDYFTRMANLVIGGQIHLVDGVFVRTNTGWVDLIERS